MLGEQARQQLWSLAAKALRGDPDAADAVTHAVAPHVAALVAQARDEERERIARLLDGCASPVLLGDPCLSAAEWAVRVIRESS